MINTCRLFEQFILCFYFIDTKLFSIFKTLNSMTIRLVERQNMSAFQAHFPFFISLEKIPLDPLCMHECIQGPPQ